MRTDLYHCDGHDLIFELKQLDYERVPGGGHYYYCPLDGERLTNLPPSEMLDSWFSAGYTSYIKDES